MTARALGAWLIIAGALTPSAFGAGARLSNTVQQFKTAALAFKQAAAEGDYARAEREARELYRQYRDDRNQHLAAVAHYSLGRVLLEYGSYAEAEPLLKEALRLWARHWGGSDHWSSNARRMLIKAAMHLGKYAEADSLSRQTLDIQEQSAREGSPDHTRLVTQHAGVLLHLGRYAEAGQTLNRALEYSRNSRDPKHLRIRAGTLEKLAEFHRQQKRYHDAERHARDSLRLYEKTRGPGHTDTAGALYQLGRILTEQGQYDEAEPLLRRSLALFEKELGPRHHNVGKVLTVLGLNASHRQLPELADEHLRRAVEIMRQSGVPSQLAHSTRTYGRVLVSQNRAPEALPYYRETLDAVDTLFANTRGLSEEVRQGFIGRYAGYYREALDLLLHLHRTLPGRQYDHEALAVVSRTQSRFFSELLRVADVNAFSTDAAFVALRDRQQRLHDRVSALRRARHSREDALDTPSEDDVADSGLDLKSRREANLRTQIAQTHRELKAVEDRLWREFPRYMELVFPRPVTVADLQKKLLRPGETLLTYALLGDATLLFAVSSADFRLHVEPVGRRDIRRLVRGARTGAEQAALTGTYTGLQSLDPATLHELYRRLVAPVEPQLAGTRRVLVVGDDALHTLPLEMLITRFGEAERTAFGAARAAASPLLGEYATLPYFGDRYRLSYLPSLASLVSQRRHPKKAGPFEKQLVSFADPVFEDEKTSLAMTNTTRDVLARLTRGAGRAVRVPRLPETADEAREIAATLGGVSNLFLREHAQEKTVKSAALGSTRYLHFATHGFLAGEFLALKESVSDTDPDAPASPTRTLAVAPAADPAPAVADEPARRPGGQPALALTLVGDLKGEDGLLTMKEVIEALRLNAELVVLSACNTAGEKTEANGGEGFAGLTRGFMYAGARGLLVSHWSVESQSTKDLMVEAFRHLKTGETPAVALQRAREWLRRGGNASGDQRVSLAHPYFWAPFVYVGD